VVKETGKTKTGDKDSE